ncbi:hypothetical protein AAHE18_20G250200 [Arachis hypogaea]
MKKTIQFRMLCNWDYLRISIDCYGKYEDPEEPLGWVCYFTVNEEERRHQSATLATATWRLRTRQRQPSNGGAFTPATTPFRVNGSEEERVGRSRRGLRGYTGNQ